ncbi:MAG: inorganic phosphate transporter [Candidatus Promineifilaceae bacterium]
MPSPGIILLFISAGLFAFLDGFHGSANVAATVVSSRSLARRTVIPLAAASVLVGPFLLGASVARTFGQELVAAEALNLSIAVAATLSAVAWKLVTWLLGQPTSSSHALFGGLLGATAAASGLGAIRPGGMITIVLALVLSPPLGMLAGFLLMRLIYFLTRNASPAVSRFFQKGQFLTSAALGLAHGRNNANVIIGVVVLGLLSSGLLAGFQLPYWLTASAAVPMAMGTLVGGGRISRTLGRRFYKVRPVHSFSVQTATSAVIFLAAVAGGPVSTTHVISSTIVGAGAADRPNKVRWGVFRDILLSWLITIPATAALAGLLIWLAGLFLPAG